MSDAEMVNALVTLYVKPLPVMFLNPEFRASWIAAVSSVVPSPTAPKSFRLTICLSLS